MLQNCLVRGNLHASGIRNVVTGVLVSKSRRSTQEATANWVFPNQVGDVGVPAQTQAQLPQPCLGSPSFPPSLDTVSSHNLPLYCIVIFPPLLSFPTSIQIGCSRTQRPESYPDFHLPSCFFISSSFSGKAFSE